MPEFQIREASPPPLAVTRRARSGGPRDIHQIQIHSTQGPVDLDLQVQATENWFGHPSNDRGGWGGSADFVVGPDRRAGGLITIVQFGDWLQTFSSWSAGYGALGPSQGYGAAEVGVAIEVAQVRPTDQYSPQLMAAVAFLCKHINTVLRRTGVEPIPPRHLLGWDQSRSSPIPRGYIGHEELANGCRLGKPDPGPFPYVLLFALMDEPLVKPKPLSRVESAIDGYRYGTTPVRFDGNEEVHELRRPRR